MTCREAIGNLGEQLLKPVNKSAIILIGMYTFAWGLWVASPFWDVFTSAPLYSALIGVIPAEWFWGSVAILCGLVTIRGALRRSYHSLLAGAGVIGWHWLIISILYFAGDWHNTGGITALFLAFYGAYIYLNLKVNHNKRHCCIDEILH